VHISEVDSKIPKNKVHEKYPVGSEVQAKVIKIDLEERRLGLSITKVISLPDPSEIAIIEAEKSTEENKEITDKESVDSPEKEAETPKISEELDLKANDEKESAVKIKKESAKKIEVEDVIKKESIQDTEEALTQKDVQNDKGESSVSAKKTEEKKSDNEGDEQKKESDLTGLETKISLASEDNITDEETDSDNITDGGN
jgi:S1 RNA binding domain.